MDNIIEFLNFEDSDLEMLDQKVEDGKRILTLQKRPVPHFLSRLLIPYAFKGYHSPDDQSSRHAGWSPVGPNSPSKKMAVYKSCMQEHHNR